MNSEIHFTEANHENEGGFGPQVLPTMLPRRDALKAGRDPSDLLRLLSFLPLNSGLVFATIPLP